MRVVLRWDLAAFCADRTFAEIHGFLPISRLPAQFPHPAIKETSTAGHIERTEIFDDRWRELWLARSGCAAVIRLDFVSGQDAVVDSGFIDFAVEMADEASGRAGADIQVQIGAR